MTRSGALQLLEDKLRDTSPLMAAIADFARSALADGHSQGLDPYLDPWEPALHGGPGVSTLIDTGNLIGSVNSSSGRNTASVGYSAFYAAFHHEGTEHLDVRLLVPTTERGIPPDWVAEIDGMISDWFGALS
jgi:phage gpG-like protein